MAFRISMSRPLRARGLKHLCESKTTFIDAVAPFTGAWIETRKMPSENGQKDVAPFTGAWIETFCPK